MGNFSNFKLFTLSTRLHVNMEFRTIFQKIDNTLKKKKQQKQNEMTKIKSLSNIHSAR